MPSGRPPDPALREWLRAIGLESLAESLERNDIDLSVLPHLSDQDLASLGLSLGQRKKLLVAAASLGQLEPGAASVAPRRHLHGPDAERRQLTVLFCDLVGSTALSRALDPETLRDLMSDYQRACRVVIERYEGSVAQYLGDGVMAYFGWPQAHEDDAERAVRAGLEIVHAVKELPASRPLQVRIGMATGPVVVGDAGGEEGSASRLAVGETPNVAARLMALAGPNDVIVAPATHRLLGGTFHDEDLGHHILKGIAEPVQAWRVLGVARAEGRFDASRRTRPLTPLVGRDEELALLLRRWAAARVGEGQVVLLSGEPGIGKSRGVHALTQHIDREPYVRLTCQCSPFHAQSPLFPFIEYLERAAGFSPEDEAEQRLDKLESLLRGSCGVAAAAPLFAALLSLPVDRYPARPLSPEKQKERTLDALVEHVVALSERQPVLFVFEDAQWIDPTTQEVLDLLVRRISELAILLLVTHRPEYAPPWRGEPHVTLLALNRLSRALRARLVERVSGGPRLPPEVVEQIVAKTDGVPLFVEELTKSVLESGVLGGERDPGASLSGAMPALAIPSTLHDSLMARLDRLGPAKEVAQVGACVGREFGYELIAAVSPLPESQLQAALGRLAASELVLGRGRGPGATYTFKHALVQDAAYASLLRPTRQQVHARIATVLDERFAESRDLQPELLAHHFTQAELHERAVPYWLAAGQRALARLSLREAISQLSTALAVNEQTPRSESHDRRELDIRMALGAASFALLGWGAREVPQALSPTRDLARRLGENGKRVHALYYLWMHHCMRAEYGSAVDASREIDEVARTTGDSAAMVTALVTDALGRAWVGDFAGARAAGERLLTTYRFDQHASLTAVYNMDPLTMVLSWSGVWLWALGWPDQARQAAREQLAHARRVGHAFDLIWALSGGSTGLLLCGDTASIRSWLEELRSVGREHAMPIAEFLYCLWDGWAAIVEGRHEHAYAQLAPPAKAWRDAGMRHQMPWANLDMAQALAALGRFEEAEVLIDEAVEQVETTGHRLHEVEVHRVRGELLHRRPHPDHAAAERAFRTALAVARRQQARGWELRTAVSYARLLVAQGRRDEAHSLLQPIHDWFTEGLDTRDLRDAKALLAEMVSDA